MDPLILLRLLVRLLGDSTLSLSLALVRRYCDIALFWSRPSDDVPQAFLAQSCLRRERPVVVIKFAEELAKSSRADVVVLFCHGLRSVKKKIVNESLFVADNVVIA